MVEKKEIPRWLSGHLTIEGLRKIEDSVREAEKLTSGEIVPMVVHRSAAIGHVRWLLWAGLIILFIALDALVEEFFLPWHLNLPGVLILVTIFTYPLASWLARRDELQRFLTSAEDEAYGVCHRAEVEFHRRGLTQTQGRTGILIFVSWMERRAVVLADRGISEQLPASTWVEVVNAVLSGAKSGHLDDGFVKAIEICGRILSRHFPAQVGHHDEVRNHLRIHD